MDPILILVAVGVGVMTVGSTAAVALFRSQQRGKDRLDLQWRSAGFAPDPRSDGYIGTYEGWSCRIGPTTYRVLTETKVATIVAAQLGWTDLEVGASTQGPAIFLGDEAFARKLHVAGSRLQIAARLTPEVRRALVAGTSLTEPLRIVDGELQRLSLGIDRDLDFFRSRFRSLSPVLTALPAGDPVPLALRTATQDPLPRMRAIALWGLAEKREPQAAPIARAALGSEDPDVRRAAALVLASLGEDMTTTILPAEDTPAGWKELVVVLSKLGATATVDGLLRRLRRSPEPALVVAGFELSRGRSDAEMRMDTLAALNTADDEVVGAALRVLSTFDMPEAEPAVLVALGRKVNAGHAVWWLGKHGSVAAVAPLVAYADSFGVVGAADKAARDAILQIQARQAGAGAGQVMVAGIGGEVDLATRGGEVSVTSDPSVPPPRDVG